MVLDAVPSGLAYAWVSAMSATFIVEYMPSDRVA
jgi:hypothetical protein